MRQCPKLFQTFRDHFAWQNYVTFGKRSCKMPFPDVTQLFDHHPGPLGYYNARQAEYKYWILMQLVQLHLVILEVWIRVLSLVQ